MSEQISLEEYFQKIVELHGDGCFVLLKLEDGKFNLLGASTDTQHLKEIISYKDNEVPSYLG